MKRSTFILLLTTASLTPFSVSFAEGDGEEAAAPAPVADLVAAWQAQLAGNVAELPINLPPPALGLRRAAGVIGDGDEFKYDNKAEDIINFVQKFCRDHDLPLELTAAQVEGLCAATAAALIGFNQGVLKAELNRRLDIARIPVR